MVDGDDAAKGFRDGAEFESGGHVPYVAFYFTGVNRMLHRVYTASMSIAANLSHTAAMILQAIDAGHIYGFSVMEATGLPSGTVYPALRRLERDELIRSNWERETIALAEQRPARKYYKITRAGRTTLEAAQKRYPLLAKLFAAESRA